MDGCHDVPPGSLVRMFTLFAQHEVQLARLNDVVERAAVCRFGRGHCPETPHGFLWQASPDTPHSCRENIIIRPRWLYSPRIESDEFGGLLC
jgi:hypothetical protein